MMRENTASSTIPIDEVLGSDMPTSVEEAEGLLIEAHDLWWRSPGQSARPYAGDGPWHLAQSEVGDVKGDYSITLLENEAGKLLETRKVDSRRPRTPLRSHEVDRRDAIMAMVDLIEVPMDRKMVWLATQQLAKGEGRVPWTAIKRWTGYKRSARRLAGRYREVLAAMICTLHGWPTRRAREIANKTTNPMAEREQWR